MVIVLAYLFNVWNKKINAKWWWISGLITIGLSVFLLIRYDDCYKGFVFTNQDTHLNYVTGNSPPSIEERGVLLKRRGFIPTVAWPDGSADNNLKELNERRSSLFAVSVFAIVMLLQAAFCSAQKEEQLARAYAKLAPKFSCQESMRMNKLLYGQFLLSSQINYTCTYLADHFDGLTHDNVQYFLSHTRIRPRDLWQSVRHQLKQSAEGYLIFDDTVRSKVHSRKIELVRSQWSGNAHSVIQGIGVVNCVYFNPTTNQFWLLDYRIFAPQSDGKTKIDHVMDMLAALKSRGVAYGCVLMDSWYAVTEIMKYLTGEQKIFYCPLKKNRKVDDGSREAGNEQQKYRQIQDLEWSKEELAGGKTVKVHKMPMDTKFKLFRVVLTTERTDYIATNDMAQSSTEAAEEKSGIRWTVEQFHREEKQTTGIESCQCRRERAQRNHIGMAVLAWTKLKSFAYQMGKTVYSLKFGQMDDYLRHQLKNPQLAFA